MKFLLVALNASYSHTNSAVRSIKEYVLSRQNIDICFGEWTINQPIGEIYKGIYEYKPDVILFSTYIWNIELVCKIIPDLKKILSDCVIGAGGPEVSYWPEGYLKKLKALDFVICGEGAKTVNDFCKVMLQNIQN